MGTITEISPGYSKTFEKLIIRLQFGAHLQRLNLSHNRLENCDEWLNGETKFERLETLDLSDNKLTAIDEGATKGLSSLRDLNVSYNQLTELPTSIADMTDLKKINVSNNRLETLPPTLGLKGVFSNKRQIIEEIDASNNALTELPPNLKTKFRFVKRLDFSGNNIQIGDDIRALFEVEDLSLGGNNLSPQFLVLPRIAPDCLHKQSYLRSLRLGKNTRLQFSKIVERLTTPCYSDLTILDLSECALSEMPVDIAKLIGLTELSLASNELGPSGPVGLGKLHNLRTLDLSGNMIEILSLDMGHLQVLEHLDISMNKIRCFDENILCMLRRLHYLACSKNELESLPVNFGKLKELQYLFLDNNRLQAFPDDRMDILGSLRLLDISSNYLDKIPTDMPYLYRMETLIANDNNFADVPADIWKMKGLETLNLSNNMIAHLPETLAKLPSIRTIDISKNRLTDFPRALDTLETKGIEVIQGEQSYSKTPRRCSVEVIPDPKKQTISRSPSVADKRPSRMTQAARRRSSTGSKTKVNGRNTSSRRLITQT